MDPRWLHLVLVLLGLAPTAWCEEGPLDAPLARRNEVTVYPTSKRPRERSVVAGEWMPVSSQLGLWMPHKFGGENPLVFVKRGAELYMVRASGKEDVAGVVFRGLTGRVELRRAVTAGASPLTIFTSAAVLYEVPPLPQGRHYALAVDNVSDLRPLARLCQLSALKLGCTTAVTDLAPLAALTEMESLWLHAPCAADLKPLAALHKLRVLRLDLCGAVADITPLTQLRSLRVLELDGAVKVADLAPLAALPRLNILTVRRCPGLLDIAPVAELRELTHFGLHGSPLVSDLAPLGRLTRLTSLELEDCPTLRDLSPLAALAGLEAVSLRACPELADVAALALLTKLKRLELLDCPRVTDLWPLRRAAQQPDKFTVDWRLRDQAAALRLASPDRVTLLMNSRYVSSVAMPPEGIGENCGWGNILGKAVAPSPSLALKGERLPYPASAHKPGAVLDFTLDGPRVFLASEQGPRKLIGVVACSPHGFEALSQAVAEGTSPLIIWSDAASLPCLPKLPLGRDYTLALLGLRAPIEPLARVANLTGLYLAHGCTDTASLAPIAHLTSLKSLVLHGTPRAESLRPLSRMTRLTSLDLSLSARVRDLSPLTRLTQLRTLRLSCARQMDFEPLACLPELSELALETAEACTDLSTVGKLRGIRMLSLHPKANVAELGFLRDLVSLTALRLCEFRSLADLSPLADLRAIEALTLRSCDRLEDLRPLLALPNLRYLDVANCAKVADVPTLERLRRRGVQLVLDGRQWLMLPGARLDVTRASPYPPPTAPVPPLDDAFLTR